ncbi:glycosyltransferase family 2 protein [Baaleninema sp.]|uniref:glycosyltransferase family 2 protein n=1 Tax=Baaleninema sp. TaxID=3101197 RepID=UPI003D00A612
MSSPAVSIVIPSYNRATLIPRAIQSVLDQTFQDWEAIVIDDASQDNTEEVVKNFKDSRIRYIRHEKNAGECATRNTGLDAATGTYIAFLDSDDWWLPEKLEKQVRRFEELSPQVGVVYTWLSAVNENGHIKNLRQPTLSGSIYGELLYANFVGTPSTVIIRRACLQAGARFDPSLRCCGDWDMWLQIARHYDFEVIEEPLVQYLDHEDEKRGSTNSHAVTEGYLIFTDKHHQKLQQNPHHWGEFGSREKAMYLLNIGRRLICHARVAKSPVAVKRGQYYLALARRVNPQMPYFTIHYLLSRLGEVFYAEMVNFENRLKRSAKLTLKPFLKKATT